MRSITHNPARSAAIPRRPATLSRRDDHTGLRTPRPDDSAASPERSGPSGHSQAQPANLSTHEAAERLGVTVGTLANWRSAGIGPAYLKIGSRVMYPLAQIEQFEQQCLIPTHPVH